MSQSPVPMLTADKKFYTVSGTKYARMTETLKCIPKPYIDRWREKVGVEEAIRILDYTSHLGSMVHLITEHWDRGDRIAYDMLLGGNPWLLEYTMAWMDWKNRRIVSFPMIERTLYTEEWGVAGQVDRVGIFVGDECSTIVDIKTTKYLNPLMGVQTYGYAVMVNETIDREGLNIPKVMRMGVAHMPGPREDDEVTGREFGGLRWKEYEMEEVRELFEDTVKTYWALKT